MLIRPLVSILHYLLHLHSTRRLSKEFRESVAKVDKYQMCKMTLASATSVRHPVVIQFDEFIAEMKQLQERDTESSSSKRPTLKSKGGRVKMIKTTSRKSKAPKRYLIPTSRKNDPGEVSSVKRHKPGTVCFGGDPQISRVLICSFPSLPSQG